MRVLFKTDMAAGGSYYERDTVHDLPDSRARQLIAANIAEPVAPPRPAGPERAAVAPPENAARITRKPTR